MRTLATVLIVGALVPTVNASPGAAQPVPQGTCYATRPLPALPSGTRVFVRSGLTVRNEAKAAGTVGEAQPSGLKISGDTLSGSPGNGFTLTDPVVVVDTSPSGERTVMRPTATICAYPAGAELPRAFAGTPPDIIIP